MMIIVHTVYTYYSSYEYSYCPRGGKKESEERERQRLLFSPKLKKRLKFKPQP